MIEIPVDQPVNKGLEQELLFGTPPVDEPPAFTVRVGDAPLALRVRSLFERFGKPTAQSLEILERGFELWLVPHRFSILRLRGHADASSLGIEADYSDNRITCMIVSLFPSSQFIDRADSMFRGTLSATGEVDAIEGNLSPDASRMEFEGLSLIDVRAADARLQLGAAVATPNVSAVGIGSSRCEWRFDRHTEPLFGRDLVTWAVVMLPREQAQISCRLRCHVITKNPFALSRYQSESFQVRCRLDETAGEPGSPSQESESIGSGSTSSAVAPDLWRSLVRVVGISTVDAERMVEAVIPSWDPGRRVRFRESILPEAIQFQLAPGVRLLADVSLGETDPEKLVFCDFRLAPQPI
jgi:hypothetical protein